MSTVPSFADAVAAELAKHPDRDAQRIVALAWIKVAVRDFAAEADAVDDVRAVLDALDRQKSSRPVP